MLLNKTGPILQAEKSVPREKDILQDDSGFSKPGNAFGGVFFLDPFWYAIYRYPTRKRMVGLCYLGMFHLFLVPRAFAC